MGWLRPAGKALACTSARFLGELRMVSRNAAARDPPTHGPILQEDRATSPLDIVASTPPDPAPSPLPPFPPTCDSSAWYATSTSDFTTASRSPKRRTRGPASSEYSCRKSGARGHRWDWCSTQRRRPSTLPAATRARRNSVPDARPRPSPRPHLGHGLELVGDAGGQQLGGGVPHFPAHIIVVAVLLVLTEPGDGEEEDWVEGGFITAW